VIDRVEFATDNDLMEAPDRRWTSHAGPLLHFLPPPAPLGCSAADSTTAPDAAAHTVPIPLQATLLETEPVAFWESPGILPMRVWARMDADGLGPIDWWC
jgi:hypothetical protein